jgi:hypothetical protein
MWGTTEPGIVSQNQNFFKEGWESFWMTMAKSALPAENALAA